MRDGIEFLSPGNRKAPPVTIAKAQRAYIAAEDAYQTAYRKMERQWRRWERLAALRQALRDGEA